MTSNSGSVGRALYNDALLGGAQALGRKSGSLSPGNWADLVSLDSESLSLCGCSDDEFLDRWIFTADDSLVCEVWSAGRQMVAQGQHIHRKEIEQRYRSVIQKIRQDL